MKPLQIFIVEDEPLITVTIETALIKQGYAVCGDAEDYERALKNITMLTPDLVLLDIQLEGKKDGIDLAKQLDIVGIPYLYLTSQTDVCTIDRVKETSPLGYIVKPFTETGLRSTIEVAWNNYSPKEKEFLIFSSDNKLYKIDQSQILYLKAYDNYCYIYTNHKKYLVPKTLKYIVKNLSDKNFIKVHRSYVININKVSALTSTSVLINAISIPLSKLHKEEIKQKLKS